MSSLFDPIPKITREEAEEARRAGAARIGGYWFAPDYDAAYLTVARWTLERARREDEELAAAGYPARRVAHVAVAVFYLQRHCLELLYKSLIGGALEVMRYGAIRDLSKKGEEEHEALAKRFSKCGHSFEKLIDLAQKTLVDGAKYEMPAGMNELAQEFIVHEDGDETRSRYASGRRGKYEDAASYPELTKIPLGDWQAKLEAVAAQCDDGRIDSGGLLRDLHDEVNGIASELNGD